MKKIIFILFVLILVIFIYSKYNKRDYLELSFGNDIIGDYNYKYKDTRIIDIIYDINSNIKMNNKYIQNILIKSKTIYIDLNNIDNVNNDYDDLTRLFDIIRIYNKNNIILVLNKDNKYTKDQIFNIINNYDIIIKR